MSDDESLAEKLAYWRANGAPGRLRRQGTTDTRPVVNDHTGRVGGNHTHHWDGRVDATVNRDPVRLTYSRSAKQFVDPKDV
jgi:hypothetical protein